MDCSMPGLPVQHQLPEFTQTHAIEVVMPSNHLILYWPFSFPLQPFPATGSFPMSQFFTSGGQYWSFSLRIGSSNEYSGLISFRMDWLDLLIVQGTLECLLQHRSSKASVLQRSAFFTVQLSHPHLTTESTIAWLHGHLLKSNICFLICCLGWSKLFFQGAIIF